MVFIWSSSKVSVPPPTTRSYGDSAAESMLSIGQVKPKDLHCGVCFVNKESLSQWRARESKQFTLSKASLMNLMMMQKKKKRRFFANVHRCVCTPQG